MRGQRVYLAGSDAFWLNVFSDMPQVEGCCDQGQLMPFLRVVPYMIDPDVNPAFTQIAVSYLEAVGAEALVTSGSGSTDEYKDIKAPERYGALLPVLHREHGDTIYAVPQRSVSLAHVLRAGEAVPARLQHDVLWPDVARYASAIEDESRPAAGFQWTAPGAARIQATLQRDDLVSVQLPWLSGWRTAVNGQSQLARADGLGFMLIRPQCQGNCEITLTWTGPPDLRVCGWITALALALTAFLVAQSM
jgi:hypothetical protein